MIAFSFSMIQSHQQVIDNSLKPLWNGNKHCLRHVPFAFPIKRNERFPKLWAFISIWISDTEKYVHHDLYHPRKSNPSSYRLQPIWNGLGCFWRKTFCWTWFLTHSRPLKTNRKYMICFGKLKEISRKLQGCLFRTFLFWCKSMKCLSLFAMSQHIDLSSKLERSNQRISSMNIFFIHLRYCRIFTQSSYSSSVNFDDFANDSKDAPLIVVNSTLFANGLFLIPFPWIKPFMFG